MFHDAVMTLTLYPNVRDAKLEVWQNACVFLFTWREHGKELEQKQKFSSLEVCERSYRQS